MKYQFEVNPDCTINKICVKNEPYFVLVIDDFLLRPDEVLHFAEHSAYFNPDGSYYPGERDLMPPLYGKELLNLLTPVISAEYFSGARLNAVKPLTKLSKVTLMPDQLRVNQRIPHVDSHSENMFATVHYLCQSQHGGTSLYRHKPSGKIKITENSPAFMKTIAEEAQSRADHKGYLNGDTSLFERVATVEAKFNRLTLFKGNLLHCADINPKFSVKEERLSIASFMFFEPTCPLGQVLSS